MTDTAKQLRALADMKWIDDARSICRRAADELDAKDVEIARLCDRLGAWELQAQVEAKLRFETEAEIARLECEVENHIDDATERDRYAALLDELIAWGSLCTHDGYVPPNTLFDILARAKELRGKP